MFIEYASAVIQIIIHDHKLSTSCAQSSSAIYPVSHNAKLPGWSIVNTCYCSTAVRLKHTLFTTVTLRTQNAN